MSTVSTLNCLCTLPAVMLLAAATASAAPAFTINQILSAPFADGIAAGPGSRVAWVMNTRGARNIWVAETPEFKGRAITAFTEDDGMDTGQISWLPSGRALVFTRGGDLEHPNSTNPTPLSRAEAVDQSIWLAPLVGGAPRKLAEGHSPIATADRVVYIKSGQVWSVGLTDGDKPAQLVHARGTITTLALSPDTSSIAMVSSRQDHAFVGVYNFNSKTLRYLDASLDSDEFPTWSPDSRWLAFIRVPAATLKPRFGAARTAKQPWTLRVADVATGRGREVFAAKEGKGSRFAMDTGATPLMWADNRLVFPWERDGWIHLYSVAVDGSGLALLTPGNFEVEHMALSADRKTVIYSSNQDDINRRHLWSVNVNGNEGAKRVTGEGGGAGIEWAPAPLENGAVAFLHSDARRPSRAAVQQGSTGHDLAPDAIPADFPASALVEPQPVMITAADGMQIHGQLFLPAAGGTGKHPALVFFHGGSRRQMLLGFHYMYYYSNAYSINQYLASLGYVVLSVNYRSGIGYGLDFREATNYGLGGASEYNDVIGAGLFLRGRPEVDPKRIGLWGGSYGGYLTALGLARASEMFKCGVDFHGVHDWTKLGRGVSADPEAARVAYESSPMASVDTWRSPVLLIHGDDDRNVPFSESVRLIEALRDRKVHVEQLVFPDEIHDFLTAGHWTQAYTAMVDFFKRML